jgi:hypothetical protein
MADNLRTAALKLLNRVGVEGFGMTRKAGSFLGQCVTDPGPLTESQAAWLATLLERAGLPPIDGGGHG